MPVALPILNGILTPNLLAMGLLGIETPRLASGVSTGLVYWVPQVSVTTTDVGSGGSGMSVPTPWLVPQPLLLGFLTANIPSAGFVGIFTPSLILGLANGLAMSFLQMFISTIHPTVGVGTGIAKFTAPPASVSMNTGFSSVGLVGDAAPRLATAIGLSLDAAIASLVIPVPIVGPGSPSAATGTGTGKII